MDRLRQWHDRRTMDPAQALGRQGEDLAHRYLEELGYTVIERNWRSSAGLLEVDLVAWHKGDPDRLVMVEVKSRKSALGGAPERNLSREKVRSLRMAAWEYCRNAALQQEIVRFDTIAIVFEPELKIEHNIDAFSLRPL